MREHAERGSIKMGDKEGTSDCGGAAARKLGRYAGLYLLFWDHGIVQFGGILDSRQL